MNYLWPALIIISFIFSVFNGTVEKINDVIYQSPQNVITLGAILLGNMCLWCGIINIIKNTRIINFLNKIIQPIIDWIFPDEKNSNNVKEKISINIISNFLGIGNAATPAGLQAMEEMQKNNTNKKRLTDSMVMLIVLNTTSIQLIPTTVFAIRAGLGSRSPANIIFIIWLSTICGTLVGIIATKILIKNGR